MTLDNVDAQPSHRPRLIDPIIERGDAHSLNLAREVEALYMSHYLLPTESQFTDGQVKTEWARLLSLRLNSQAAREGAMQLQKLLDDSLVNEGIALPISSPSQLKFRDPVVHAFLLQTFSRDSRIKAKKPEEQLGQIFTALAGDLYLGNGGKSTLIESGEVEKIRNHFTANNLTTAIEFFLVEPALLPKIPPQRPSEK